MRKLRRLIGSGGQSEDNSAAQGNDSRDTLGPSILHDGTSNPNSGVDIVFVHGLRGSSYTTWSKGDVCWPRDLLKYDIPDSRIITWGYDSSVAKVLTYASVESIYGHAETILIDLSSLRRSITRPIVFAAHSLGGLVVKEALIKAAAYKSHGRHLDLADIYTRTQGVIFFGTPHRGSTKESLGEVVAGISKYCLRRPNKQLLRTLRTDSHILENQRDQFITISQDISVICVRETIPTAIGIVVPESSASYDSFKVQRSSINANHMDLVRYPNRGDYGYRKAVGHLVDLAEPTKLLDEGYIEVVLNILHFDKLDYREHRIEDAYEKTFQWIVSDHAEDNTSREPTFISWLQSGESLLWISGKAASGKSTLMKYLHKTQSHTVERCLEDRSSSQIIASFFLHERGGGLQKSREGMLRSILYQVLSADKTLVAEVYATRDAVQLDWESLQSAFNRVLQCLDSRASMLFLFLDGLDEYRIVDRLDSYTEEDFDLIYDGENDDAAWGTSSWIVGGHHEVARFVRKLEASSVVRVCFSSREVPVFEDMFRKLSRIRVHTHTRGDIYKVCQGRLSQEASCLVDKESFAEAITESASGVFLWVKLVIDMLVKGSIDGDTPEELWATLKYVPRRLGGKNGLYMLMVRHILDQHKAESSRIFEIVLRAHRPLHLAHVFIAAESLHGSDDQNPIFRRSCPEPTWTSFGDFETHCETKARRLKSRCAGLLEANPEVQFMHQTAKEFISRRYVWESVFGIARDDKRPAIPMALIKGSIGFIRMLSGVDISKSLNSQWTQHGMVSIQQTMYHLLEVDKSTKDLDTYARLVEEFDETCRNSSDVLRDPVKTGAPRESNFSSWMPAFTEDVFSSWFNTHPPVDYFSPYFNDFNAYATQYDLANYIEHILGLKPPLERVEYAQNLLGAASSVYNYDGYHKLHANERVIVVLLSNGASPNKTMLRYTERNNLDNAGEEYTMWVDLIEAGCDVVPSTRDSLKSKFLPRRMSRRGISWAGGVVGIRSFMYDFSRSIYPEWLRLVSLLLEYGASLDAPAVFLKDFESSDDGTGRSNVITIAAVLGLILEDNIAPSSPSQLKVLTENIQKKISTRAPDFLIEPDGLEFKQ